MKIHNFWLTWTICTSNESWRHSEFKLDIIKYNLFWKFLRFWIFQIFRLGFFEKKNFPNWKFEKFSNTTPKIYILHLSLTPKMKITWRFDTPNFIPDKAASLQSPVGLIQPTPPSPAFLGLKSLQVGKRCSSKFSVLMRGVFKKGVTITTGLMSSKAYSS